MRLYELVLIAAGVLIAAAIAMRAFIVGAADGRLNGVSVRPPYEVGDRARQLHSRLLVADLHSDFLLWRRDFARRYDRGHVDLPRLRDGNIGLQVFSVVTKSPWGQNYESNAASSDRITLIAVAQAWPVSTWSSLADRALFQSRRLHRFARRGDLSILHSAADLDAFLETRASGSREAAGLLALEGMHALEGRIDVVDTLFAAGFRMMAPAHMFDNDIAGSAHGVEQHGLTELGRDAIRRMQELGIIIDLAHASEATIRDVLEITQGPVVVSHTGVRGTCESPRNLSDDQIVSIAERDGVLGIGFWDGAVCGTMVKDIARAIRYTADLVGTRHVAFGSDFDGTVATPFDASGMPLLTEALLEVGFREEEIEQIAGGNVVRLLREVLPAH